jgi:hypothetical protein
LLLSSELSSILYKNFNALCREAGIEGRERGRVFWALLSLSTLAYTVALRDVIAPVQKPECACGSPVQVAAAAGDLEDPLRRSIYRVVNWYTRDYNRES